MSDEEKLTPEQETMDEAVRWYYSEIMRQLIESERFVNWFQMNFDVHRMINEEEKTIDIRVLEIPPELVQARMQEQIMAKIKQKAKESSGIVTASPGDLKQLEQAAKKRRKRK